MKTQMIKMNAEKFEWKLTQKWLDGHHHVKSKLEEYLKQKAADAFMKGDDAKAKMIRDDIPKLLHGFFADQKKYAEEHEKNYKVEQKDIIEFEE